MLEDKLPSTKVPIIPKKRSVCRKPKRVAIRSTYILRSRTVSHKLTKGKEKGPLFAKEIMRSIMGLGVCSEKPITAILVSDSFPSAL